MVARIVDENSLLVEADFHMKLDISAAYPVKNPDGSNPNASIHVKADTVKFGLAILKQLGENENYIEEIVTEVINQNIDTIGIDVERYQETGDLTEDEYSSIDAFMGAEVTPWREFTISATGVMDGRDQSVTFVLTAPSYVILVEAFEVLSSRNSVNQTAVSFYPIDEDAEDYDY